MKRVVISCGPIPARLDSVKYITNRFKGGLAFRTASHIIAEKKYDVTIVIWEQTEIPFYPSPNTHIIKVKDVYEYYNWFKENATNYDAFIMAAAVANLSPVSPWVGKFPSHLYGEGEQFDIKFQIAPRAIDVIKKLNPRCCLIGYKLFDAETDEELIAAAEHTLLDSRANIVFANTPATAKTQKIMLTQDGVRAKMSFDDHLKMIVKALDAEYFETKVTPLTAEEEANADIRHAFAIVEMFEKTFPGYGTVAVPVPINRNGDLGMATTSRGHKKGPVLVRFVDENKRTVFASDKATLNAATLYALMQERNKNRDAIIIHRHINDTYNSSPHDVKVIPYEFPGTTAEVKTVLRVFEANPDINDLRVEWHGDYGVRDILPVDWKRYYEDFPNRYFSVPTATKAVIDQLHRNNIEETLEVGGNMYVATKYAYDPYVNAENAINLSLEEVMSRDFDLIIANNSINYLPKHMIEALIKRTPRFVANSFCEPPQKKVTEQEAVICDEATKMMHHALRLKNDSIVTHNFFAYTKADYEDMGFSVVPYSRNSVWLSIGLAL